MGPQGILKKVLRRTLSLSHHEELRALSAPWRTRVQLSKLAAAPRPAGQDFSFAVMGDVEPCRFRLLRYLFNQPDVFSRQMDAIRGGRQIDFTVQLGDMVSKGTPHFYREFLTEIAGLPIDKPYLTVIGNHDRSRPNGKSQSSLYRGLFGQANYSFDHAGVRFVTLDTSAKKVTTAQLKWLRMVLDTPMRKIVFTHIPPVVLGLWGGVVHGIGGFSENAHEFVRVMSEMGVSRVYMGHVHAFGVQDHRGVRYVLTGGGGSALFPSGSPDIFHHYLTVTIGPESISETVHPLDGEPFRIPDAKVLLGTSNVSEPLPALLGYT